VRCSAWPVVGRIGVCSIKWTSTDFPLLSEGVRCFPQLKVMSICIVSVKLHVYAYGVYILSADFVYAIAKMRRVAARLDWQGRAQIFVCLFVVGGLYGHSGVDWESRLPRLAF
jgi:hypothetical protein